LERTGRRIRRPGTTWRTETGIVAIIDAVREVPKTDPLGGVHLTVKVKAETIDVAGSKVQAGAEEILLAREIGIGRTSLILRDEDGTPLWQGWVREPVPTGY
jgi:hypothetical protein